MWSSRDGWLAGLHQWAKSSALESLCAAERVSITGSRLCAIAAVMADSADHRTGRHVAITRARIAAAAGCDPRTVTTAWRVLRVAGWAVEAARGHGSPGTPAEGRRPSVYHLVPRREAAPSAADFHLPPKAAVVSSSPVSTHSPSTPERAEEISTTPKHRPNRAPRPLALQRLAAALVARTHGTGRGHIGGVCDALTASGIDPAVWSARAITDALDADMKARGWSWPDRITRPGAFLAYRLRQLQLRSDGPQNGGGVAAASTDEDQQKPGGDSVPFTAEQAARIAAARAEIRGILARKSGAVSAPLRRTFGAPLARSRCNKTQGFQLGSGEESAGADGPVFGGVGPEFVVCFGAQLRCAVAVVGESGEGGGGLRA